MARPTIADIAERAGVSKGAVSFALNGRPGVSEATRERILRIAEEMQWQPHSAARALGNSRTGAVGLILRRPARTLGVEPFFGELVSGLQIGLKDTGTALQLLIVADADAELAAYRQWAAARRVDGFVLVDLLVDDPRPDLLAELGVPTIVLGGPLEHSQLPCSAADDAGAMQEALDYLAALGHRRIAHVAGAPDYLHTRRRMDVVAAANAAGIEAWSLTTDFSDADGARATRALLSRRERPTAIVFDSDVMAVAGLGVTLEMGVKVPDELSILSFDDSLLTRLTHPSLTALTRDTQAWVADAARALIDLVAGPEDAVVPASPAPQLTVRESTARAASP